MNSDLLTTIKSLIHAARAEVEACEKIMVNAKGKKDAALAKIESYNITYADIAKIQDKNNLEPYHSDALQELQELQELANPSSHGSVRGPVISAFAEGEKLTVGQVFERVVAQGSQSNKPTVNAALHRLAKAGILENVSVGVYMKPQKVESRL